MKRLHRLRLMVRGVTALVGLAIAPLTLAQYCPGGTTYFATVYYSCSLGSCWAASPFTGSTAGSVGDPNNYYACATSTPATGALENTLYTYDGNGNRTSIKDPLGRTTTNTMDALNRLSQLVDPYNGATKPTIYAYDGNSVLAQVTDPRTLVTSYTINGFGETTRLQSPDTGIADNTYDLAGNLKTRTDARGVLATYTYDDINRVTQIVFTKSGSPTETHAFEYDGGVQGAPNAKGRLTKVTDSAGLTSWTYEPHGRVATKAQTIGSVTLTTTYGYNAFGQLQTMTTPSGQIVGFTYLNNQVRSITVNGATLVSGVNFDPFGPLAAWSWGNGQLSARHHDYDGRIDQWLFGSPTNLLRNNLTFYANSNINTINDPANAALKGTYQYDTLNRLTVSQKGNPVTSTQQFTYDPTGNRSTLTVNSTLTNYTYPATSNQLQALTGGTSRSYTYDAAGNPTTIAGQTHTYNLANRLVGISSGTTYKVNALGQRVQKVVGSATTHFVYDEQGHLLGEYDGTGLLIQETVWLDDVPIAVLASNRGLPPVATTQNVALAANGGVASALNSLSSSYPASSTINGDRLGNNWGAGGGWASIASTFPNWLEVDFNGPKAVTEIDVFAAQDNLSNPSTPTLSTTFKKYGIKNFTVQYWDGATWQAVPGGVVTGNNKVWRQFTFAAITTSKVRVLITAAADTTSRIVELEAWASIPPGASATTYYLHADHLGTPRAITRTSDNTFEWRWDNIDSFGANAPNENPAGHGTFKYGLRFPGQYYDAESATHYNYYRDYDPIIGRYEQSDAIGVNGGLNTYNYVQMNPLSYVDGLGLQLSCPNPKPNCVKSCYDVLHVTLSGCKLIPDFMARTWCVAHANNNLQICLLFCDLLYGSGG